MRIIGLCIVGEGEAERYLQKTKDCFAKLCDETVYWHDKREWGLYQNKIKEDALKEVIRRKPDWILALDADEELLCTREELETLTKSDEISYRFYFIQKWNDEEHINEGFNFWDMRFFKWLPEMGLDYQNTPLHCGMGPMWTYQYAWDAPYLVIHRGLLKKSDRIKKVERYRKYDPKMVYCSPLYYEGLLSETAGQDYNYDKLKQMVEEAVRKNGTRVRPPLIKQKQMIFHRHIRLIDDMPVDVPEPGCIDNINTGGRNVQFKCLGPIVEYAVESIPVSEIPIEVDKLECKVCGFLAKNDNGMRLHSRRHG